MLDLLMMVLALPGYALLIMGVGVVVRLLDYQSGEPEDGIDHWKPPAEDSHSGDSIPVGAVANAEPKPVEMSDWSQVTYGAPSVEQELSYQNLPKAGYPRFGFLKALALAISTVLVFLVVMVLLIFFFWVMLSMLWQATGAAADPFDLWRGPSLIRLLMSFLVFNGVALLVRQVILQSSLGDSLLAVLSESVILFGTLWLVAGGPME